MNPNKRLYIITGKGGVGKTNASFALVKYLIDSGKNAKYLIFKSNTISKESPTKIKLKYNLPAVELDLLDCATEYVGRKMKSTTIANWVVKTPFFRALINMLPGFSYLIYLGKTVDLLNQDPNLVLVMDSPSSGHALTMFESMKNYQEIFQTGLLFEDTKKVLSRIYEKDFTKTIILSLPTLMACHECLELESDIQNINPIETQVICNNVISKIKELNEETLPQILKDKLSIEKEVLNKFNQHITNFIPYIPEIDDKVLLEQFAHEVGGLV